MVEFAIAVPVLLLLMCVAAEAGHWLYQYNTLHKLVRDGVRYVASEAMRGTSGGMYDPESEEWLEIMAQTQNLVHHGHAGDEGDPVLQGLTADDIEVTQVDSAHVQVSASYDYDPIFDVGIPTFGFGDGPIDFDIGMTAAATMRAL